ncbi:hypothetical protein G6696_03540 [Polynucleobacter paneuropaeus]|nr:hypothetical protein G6696_03540 [Polynucleobacter paneuropaeus]
MMDALLSWRPSSWLEWLLLYILPGAVMAIFILFIAWRDRPTEFIRGITRLLSKETSLVDRLKEFLIYCFAISCVLLGWPGFMIYYYRHRIDEKANQAWQALPDFDCAPEYLVSQVNPIDAEIASYVVDPLGAVPPLPFGHLNAGWVNFLSDMTDDADEMWSFYIPKGGKTGKYQFETTSETRGYARVRDGKILAEFITERD